MNALAPLAAAFGIEIDAVTDRLKTQAIFGGIIGLFALIGVGFLLVAVHAWLAAWLGPIWAPLIIAGSSLLIAGIVLLIMKMSEGGQKRRDMERRRANETSALVTTAALAALPTLLQSRTVRYLGLPLAAIGIVGLLGKRRD